MANGDEAESVQFVPLPELPTKLTREAHEAIRRHAVSLLVANEDEVDVLPCGGTFVRVGGIAGVLTARHVWEAIRSHSKLIFVVGEKPYRVSTKELTALAPNIEETLHGHPAKIPDIALIPLSPAHIATIEAQGKVFYSIDRRLSDDQFDVFGNRGFWVAVGSPKSRLITERRAVSSFLYDTGIERTFVQGSWDFVLVNLNVESNPAIPQESYRGMSGGGLWRARYHMTLDRSRFWFEDVSRDIALVGVTFFETGLPGRQLIAHGPQSLYRGLPPFVRTMTGKQSNRRDQTGDRPRS